MSAATSAQTRTKPFMFDRSFDDPSKVYLPGEKYGPKIEVSLPKRVSTDSDEQPEAAEAVVEDAPPPPPAKEYTEADLQAAREDGHVQGHTAALEEAETAREHYAADALNLITTVLDGLQEQQSAANREIGETALRMAYAVIEKVVPLHAQAHAIESVAALVKEVLPLVYEEPKLVVRTHNMIAEDVQSKLDEVTERSNFQGVVSIVPDYELQPGDCRVEWNGGGADRNEGRLWKDIRAIIEENIGAVDIEAMDNAADADEHTIEDSKTDDSSDEGGLIETPDSSVELEEEPEELAIDDDAGETESDQEVEPDPSGT